MYTYLYQDTVGDKNTNNSPETQALIDTRETFSLIFYGTYQHYCKLQNFINPIQIQ